jgi:hypothetical protein
MDDDHYEEGIEAMMTAGRAYVEAGGRDEDELERVMLHACRGSTTSMLIVALARLYLLRRFG